MGCGSCTARYEGTGRTSHPGREEAPEEVRRYVRAGASPRGLQALITAGQVRALLEGRYNASIEDVQALAYAVLRHRVRLNFEGLTTDALVDRLLDAVSVLARGRSLTILWLQPVVFRLPAKQRMIVETAHAG